MQISYTWVFWVALACYMFKYDIMGGIITSTIFITLFNATSEMVTTIRGKLNKKKGYVTQAEYTLLQKELEELKEENHNILSEFLKRLKEKEELYASNLDAIKHNSTVEGQDAVFKAFILNQPLFQKFLFDYQQRMAKEKDRKKEYHKRPARETKPSSSWRTVLNVSKDADEAEVNSAYKTLVKKYHPDINKTPEASAKMMEINEAKEQAEKHFKKVA